LLPFEFICALILFAVAVAVVFVRSSWLLRLCDGYKLSTTFAFLPLVLVGVDDRDGVWATTTGLARMRFAGIALLAAGDGG